MIEKIHRLELWINGKLAEFEDQESVNIRLNNVLADPSKISSNQGEYSFSFDLPCTPRNNEIFDYANALSKTNKFRTRLNAKLIADGTSIFDGSLTIASIKNGMYKVNLVSYKQNSYEELFGELTMHDIKKMKRDANGTPIKDSEGNIEHESWSIPFEGASSINAANFEGGDVMFPLISYGAFAKKSVPEDTVLPVTRPIYYGNYTSKFDIDEYNEWYYSSIYPSHNLLQTIKYAFETANLIAEGDIFQDEVMKNLYMSVNLADEQVPTYNIGNPKFGKVDFTTKWVCPQDTSSDMHGISCNINFKTMPNGNVLERLDDFHFNCEKIRVYDMLLTDDGRTSFSSHTDSYMFEADDNLVVIPSDGFYKVTLAVEGKLLQSSDITAKQWIRNSFPSTAAYEEDIEFAPDMKICCPIEIQLVRNFIKSDEAGIELIHGYNGIIIYTAQNRLNSEGMYGDYRNMKNSFPHDKLGSNVYSSQATVSNDEFGEENLRDVTTIDGLVPKDNEILCYDPAVSDTFICGFSTWGNKASDGKGCMSVMKDGRSWSNQFADHKNQSFYTQSGYVNRIGTAPYITNVQTMTNKNYLPASMSYYNQNDRDFDGRIETIVYLNRNDVLRLVAIHRDYEKTDGQKVSYSSSATARVTIEAASPKTQAELRNDMANGKYYWTSPTQFDRDLNLAEFFSKETLISDWVKDIQNAFNLDITQYNNLVSINKKKKPSVNASVVNIDDRVKSSEAEAKAISYPRTMAVKYKIDEDEWGAESSAIENYGSDSIMNTDYWKNYIERGYSVIELADDTFVATKSEKQLRFAYTWYDTFRYFSGVSQTQPTLEFRTPVISKFQYMVSGYDYEESRKHDGYGLAQRFWFKPQKLEGITLPLKGRDESMNVYIPKNTQGNFNLSYRNTEESILSKFFNVSSYLASNYVEVEVYLTPEEYNRLKNGALVRFNSDNHYVAQISGYDASGKNPTKLLMYKKVV